MLSLDAVQLALIASEDVTNHWSFIITDKNGVKYQYVMSPIGSEAWAPGEAWGADEAWDDGADLSSIILTDFSGVELRRNSAESGIIAPSEVSFKIANADNTLTASDFKGGTVLIEYYLSNVTYGTRKIAGWLFRIKSSPGVYQQIEVTAEDFLQYYLKGDYPNTRYPADIFPSSRTYNNDICVPVPFGTAYLPLRDVVLDAAKTLTASTLATVQTTSGSRCKITDSANGLAVFDQGWPILVSGFTTYKFTVTSAAATIGATYTNNSITFTVLATIAAGTTLYCSGSGAPSTSGTLTKTSGTGDAAIAFSAFTAPNNGTFISNKVSASEIEFDIDDGFYTEAVGASVTLTQQSAYILLGDPAFTYTISKVRSPRSLGTKSEYTSTNYTFTQSTITDRDSDTWRAFQAIIFDLDKDGTMDAAGFFGTGDPMLDPLVEFTRSDTATLTSPGNVFNFVAQDIGIPVANIGAAAITTANTTYATWGLTFNGGYYYKQDREKVLAGILNQCHSCLDVGETVDIRVLSKISKATITSADILRTGDGPGTFKFTDLVNDDSTDSVYVAWQKSGEAQDSFLKVIVPIDAVANTIPKDVLECNFVQDSQDIQRIGKLYGQRKYGKEGTVSWNNKGTRLYLQPDDVVTISGANYNGSTSYDVLIDSVKILPDGSLSFSCTKFANAFNDWGDLSPTALVIPTDTTAYAWQPTISGPQTDQNIGISAFDTWGKEYLTVGPIANQGKFTDMQKALNAVKQAGGGAIYILNGDYQMTAPLYVPDVNLEVLGQSQGGVVLKNLAGSDLFVLRNLTKTFNLHQFSIASQNVASYTHMLYVVTPGSSMGLAVSDLTVTLADNDTAGYSSCDSGIMTTTAGSKGKQCLVDNLKVIGGSYGIYSIGAFEKVITNGGIFDEQLNSAINIVDADGVVNGATITNIRCLGIYAASSDATIYRHNFAKNHLTAKEGSDVHSTVTAILLSGGESIISENDIVMNPTRADAFVIGIQNTSSYALADRNEAISNKITLNVNTSLSAYGIFWYVGSDGTIKGNSIKISNLDNTFSRYGINLFQSSRNVIAGNNIDMVNNNAKDKGISLSSGSNNNQGGDNITYNCGTSIADSGTGNAVTGQDV